jgi:hypothetical protein
MQHQRRQNGIRGPGKTTVHRRHGNVVREHQQHISGVVAKVQQAEQHAVGEDSDGHTVVPLDHALHIPAKCSFLADTGNDRLQGEER